MSEICTLITKAKRAEIPASGGTKVVYRCTAQKWVDCKYYKPAHETTRECAYSDGAVDDLRCYHKGAIADAREGVLDL